jgi:hypothetical protein
MPRKNDGRIKRFARRALAAGGGRCSTGDVAALAYPPSALSGPNRWGNFRNCRRALEEFARPVGRGGPPGHALLWEMRNER